MYSKTELTELHNQLEIEKMICADLEKRLESETKRLLDGARFYSDKANELQKEINELKEKGRELANEYTSILKKFNYQLKLKGDEEMDYQTIFEFMELLNKLSAK